MIYYLKRDTKVQLFCHVLFTFAWDANFTSRNASSFVEIILKSAIGNLPLIAESIFLNSTKIRTASSSGTPSGICRKYVKILINKKCQVVISLSLVHETRMIA